MKVISAMLLLILGQSLASPALAPYAVAVTTDLTRTQIDTIYNYLTEPVSGTVDCVSGQQATVTVTAPPSTVTVTEWAECNSALTGGVSASAYQATKQFQSPSFALPPLFSSRAQSAKATTERPSSHDLVTLSSTIAAVSPVSGAMVPPQSAAPSVKPGSSTRSTSFSQLVFEPTTMIEPENAGALPTGTIVQSLKPTDPVYTALALYSHNVHRANHTGTNPLSYNTTLVRYAREKALSCIWDETLPVDATGVGMNLAEGTYIGAANVTATIEDMWYNSEISLFPGYGVPNPDMSDFNDWGHFTQVVWRATISVGCWSSACKRNDGAANEIGSGFFTVCMYYPEGNVAGEYADQVARPRGRATIHGL